MILRCLHIGETRSGQGMDNIAFIEREVTETELQHTREDFDRIQQRHGNPIQPATRHTFVAMDGESFIGCVSGIRDNNWYYLSDLWVAENYRTKGIGRALLRRFEERIALDEGRHIYTWTAGYEAPAFYHKQGYTTFAELEGYFPSGHSRVGLRKRLS